MDYYNIYEIAEALRRLFHQQMDAITGGGPPSLSESESSEYSQRAEQIRELLAQLDKFRRPT